MLMCMTDGTTLLKLTKAMVGQLLPIMKLQVSFLEAQKSLHQKSVSPASSDPKPQLQWMTLLLKLTELQQVLRDAHFHNLLRYLVAVADYLHHW